LTPSPLWGPVDGTRRTVRAQMRRACSPAAQHHHHPSPPGTDRHNGPVWQVAWAHPKFGSILASCSYDRQVIIWKELSRNNWVQIYQHRGHDGSVNSIAWSPHEQGLCLACGSSDETISVLTSRGNGWEVTKFKAHRTGCNAVSWAPAAPINGISFTPTDEGKRLVSGGCDNQVKIWRCTADGLWEEELVLPALHTDWVRDVAWSPAPKPADALIATCSQDKKVVIWKLPKEAGQQCTYKEIAFSAPVWRVSWSVTGTILAVSCGDDVVTLWKETSTGEWESLGHVDESNHAPQQ